MGRLTSYRASHIKWPRSTRAEAEPRQSAPSKRACFQLRCEARAYLFAAGEYTLQETVDQLQADAEASGLVAEIGQDAVQAIMSAAFGAVRDDSVSDICAADIPDYVESSPAEAAWNAEGWREAALDYHQARGTRVTVAELRGLPPGWDAMSLGALWDTLNDPQRHGVAKSTLDAAEYLIRANDPKRFEAWLLKHSAAERAAIIAHIKEGERENIA